MASAASFHDDQPENEQGQPASEITAFRDALAEIAHTAPLMSDVGHHIADRILAMPEMRTIRRLLWVLDSDIKAERADGHHYTDVHDEWDTIVHNAPHIARWVRADP